MQGAAQGRRGLWLWHVTRVEVLELELALHGDIYLVMGVRDSKWEAGEP